MFRVRSRLALWVILLVGVGMFALGNHLRKGRETTEEEMSVVLPVPIEIVLFGGDRYLAANIDVWRAIMVGVDKLQPRTLAALAALQENASWLNPGHEDNYYTATAILPWEGHLSSAQTILRRAMDARPKDIYPGFFHGFNQMEFYGDFDGAAKSALVAAEHATDSGDRQALTVIAARWAEKSEDISMSQRMVEAMARSSHDPALKNYLLQRVERLKGLALLRQAAAEFKKKTGRELEHLDDLVREGLISQIPVDPLGEGYDLRNHWPVLRSATSN